MEDAIDAAGWSGALNALGTRLHPRFGRVEVRRRALAYLRGLLGSAERKNGWQLAEAAGDRTPDAMQDFLSRTRWDADAVRDDLQAYVGEHLGDADAVLILDETGFLKKGNRSAGVKRQYSGTAGRIENCQIGVFLGYASRHGRALIDRALYLPESWTDDRQRCAAAGIAPETAFATKPKIGLALVERALDRGLPCAWVTADSVYGGDYTLRTRLQDRRIGYVLAVTRAQRFGFGRVEDVIEALPATAWHRLSAGDGAKGPRLYDWAFVPYPVELHPGWQRGLLIRRSRQRPENLAYYLTFAPEAVTLPALVRIAGSRWAIEACFEAAKGEVGLDHYEVRSWTGWHRHITLAMLALAFLTVVRKGAKGGSARRRRRRDPASPHRAGNPPLALAPDRPAARSRRRHGLVALATTPPAEGRSRALESSN